MSSKAAAKRNIDSVSRAYVNSKRASAELENCTRGLVRGGTSVPLLGTTQEVQQVRLCAFFQNHKIFKCLKVSLSLTGKNKSLLEAFY